jgi:hypothetical protein
MSTRCRTFRASRLHKLHWACEPGASSRIGPSTWPLDPMTAAVPVSTAAT